MVQHTTMRLLISALCVMTCFLATKGHNTTIRCVNTVPGLEKMLRGVDITQLDLLPTNILASNGFKSSIVAFTCNLNHTRDFGHGKVFQQPDQVIRITSLPAAMAVSDVQVYKTEGDVKRRMAADVGLSYSHKNFSFSRSLSYEHMQRTLLSGNKYVAEISAVASAHRVDFDHHWLLEMDEGAQIYVDDYLSGTYETNPDAYKSFINIFGTHYFSSGNFGGYIRALFTVSTDYFDVYGEPEAKANVKESFRDFISFKGEQWRVPDVSARVSSTFTRKSSRVVRYYGGDTNLMEDNLIPKWMSTVDRDPWLFSGILRPISDLISNETKKAEMVKAVKEYVDTSYLDELQREIEISRSVYNFPNISPMACLLRELSWRINDLKMNLSDTTEVEIIGRNVTTSLTLRRVSDLSRDLGELNKTVTGHGCMRKEDKTRLKLWLHVINLQDHVMNGEYTMLAQDVLNAMKPFCEIKGDCTTCRERLQREYTATGIRWAKGPYTTIKYKQNSDIFTGRLYGQYCSDDFLSTKGNHSDLAVVCEEVREWKGILF